MILITPPYGVKGICVKIAVLVKAVPDVKNVRLAIRGNDIETGDLGFVINEQDSYALEEGLKLKEKFGGELVVASMGDDARKKGMTQVIRECYAKGADRGIMLLDNDYGRWDDMSRAKILAALLSQEKPDVILCGSQSFDAATSRIGPMLAEFMSLPHASLITSLEPLDGGRRFRVSRDLEQGIQEILEIEAPCVLTTQTGINTPRYAALSKIIMATRKEIRTLSSKDTGIDAGEIEKLNGVTIVAAGFPEERQSKVVMLSGTPDEEAAQLLRTLKEKGLLQR